MGSSRGLPPTVFLPSTVPFQRKLAHRASVPGHRTRRMVPLNSLQSGAAERAIAAALELDQSARDAYWKQRNLVAAIQLLGQSIALLESALAHGADSTARTAIQSAIKQSCYNLASFTWPGWGEPDLAITSAQQAMGYAAARRNLQLAHDLDKPPIARSRAHWLCGAHQLSAGEFETASVSFQQAASLAEAAGAQAEMQLSRGYGELVEIVAARPRPQPGAERRWQEILRTLSAFDDGAALVQQLQVARRIHLDTAASDNSSP